MAAKIATLLSSTQIDAKTLQNKYTLSEPHSGYNIIAITMYTFPSNNLFPGNYMTMIYGVSSDNKRIESWTSLPGSFYGSCDPVLALSNAGYIVGGKQSDSKK